VNIVGGGGLTGKCESIVAFVVGGSSFVVFLHERSQWAVGGRWWVVGGAFVFQGEEAGESFGKGVFGGAAVAGQGVEPRDVPGDRASFECFGVETIDCSRLPD
jgi:hypothetical protein